MTPNILLLGGTTEAASLARALAATGLAGGVLMLVAALVVARLAPRDLDVSAGH